MSARKTSVYFQCIIIGIIAHYIMLSLNIIFKGPLVFIIQNVAALIVFAVFGCLRKQLSKQDNVYKAIFWTITGIWIQVIISTLTAGWKAGFQNYFFATLTASFIFSDKNKTKENRFHQTFVQVMSTALYFILLIVTTYTHPLISLHNFFIELMMTINSIVTFSLIIAFSTLYAYRFSHSIELLKKESKLDELTQLNNRHAIRDVFDSVRKDMTSNAIPFSITILDIDDFKMINDTYGHNTGDKVLMEISKVIKTNMTPCSHPCRWGGEEFLIVDQYGENQKDAIQRIEKIRKEVAELRFVAKEKTFSITVSAGISFSNPDIPIHEIIDKADNRLYWGKRHGKNKTVVDDT